MQNNVKKAFTLIELLIAIAIIAILAAILFPVFARARENARRTNCASNLKQIALGIMQYTQDNDEYFPRPRPFGGGPGDWVTPTLPYLKNTQLFRCPSHHQPAGAIMGAGPRNDYAYNVWFSFGSSDPRAPRGTISQATLTQVSLTVMVLDYFQWDGKTGPTARADGAAPPVTEMVPTLIAVWQPPVALPVKPISKQQLGKCTSKA